MAKIGIDLGTTTSLVSVYRDGKVELIPNKFGNVTTPSVVGIDEDGSLIVGEIAKERLISHPDKTVGSFKRYMGTDKTFVLGDRKYSSEELSSFVISSLLEDAKNYLQEEIKEAVISVPAYFHDKQRVATRKAGELAGIKVNRLINEPSAAALFAYMEEEEEKRFLIFDFGGGTLDISIVECFENMVEILAVAGDNHLGGDDFNQVIAKSFLEEHKIAGDDLSKEDYAGLIKTAESIKRQLSEQEEVLMYWNYRGQTYQSTFHSQRLIEDGAALFGRMKGVIHHALRDGQFMARDMNMIICAGGSSKMPAVREYLRHLFGDVSQSTADEQEMIARGLGTVLGIMDREEKVRDYILTDICPFTLGIATLNEADPDNSYMTPIIPRNTALPSSRVKRFYTTYDRQNHISVRISQGEDPYEKNNLFLGELSIPVRPRPAGEESIDVRFTYDIDGILEVDVTVVSSQTSTGKVFAKEVDKKELGIARKNLQKLKHHPKEDAKNILLKERLLSAYAMSMGNTREFIMHLLNQFEETLNSQESRRILFYQRYLERSLEEIEKIDPFYQPEEFAEEDFEDEWDDDTEDDGIEEEDYE
ncbi:MAG TPA: Hsp70 family protein [Lachnospiraceae bacterium]